MSNVSSLFAALKSVLSFSETVKNRLPCLLRTQLQAKLKVPFSIATVCENNVSIAETFHTGLSVVKFGLFNPNLN